MSDNSCTLYCLGVEIIQLILYALQDEYPKLFNLGIVTRDIIIKVIKVQKYYCILDKLAT